VVNVVEELLEMTLLLRGRTWSEVTRHLGNGLTCHEALHGFGLLYLGQCWGAPD
jgi:hypothetical protein